MSEIGINNFDGVSPTADDGEINYFNQFTHMVTKYKRCKIPTKEKLSEYKYCDLNRMALSVFKTEVTV